MPPKNTVEILIDQFSRLPGLGPKSSRRIVLHLLKNKSLLIEPMIRGLEEVVEKVDYCGICGNLTLSNKCSICLDTKRQEDVICIVETVSDLWAIEKTGLYSGQYHVLGGVLSRFEGIGPEELKIPQLVARIEQNSIKEVILALNATVNGQTTAHFLAEEIANPRLNITSLGKGIPFGGELDYLDSGTISAALTARQNY
ncbi:MAG: recombination mediator RecR [Rhodobacteraceae bacterium]|nr:recombination mediator RecR [Paracoccaceae bacterium]